MTSSTETRECAGHDRAWRWSNVGALGVRCHTALWPVTNRIPWQADRTDCSATSPLSLEPRRCLRVAGHVASAVRMRPGPGEVAAGDNQVFLANGTALEPAF